MMRRTLCIFAVLSALPILTIVGCGKVSETSSRPTQPRSSPQRNTDNSSLTLDAIRPYLTSEHTAEEILDKFGDPADHFARATVHSGSYVLQDGYILQLRWKPGVYSEAILSNESKGSYERHKLKVSPVPNQRINADQ
jgi:hypothetical protein